MSKEQSNLSELMLKNFEEIKKDIKSIEKLQTELNTRMCLAFGVDIKLPFTVVESLPENINLPFNTDECLIKFNEELCDNTNLQSLMVRFLYDAGVGQKCSTFLMSIVRKVLTREVAMLYSRLGRKGKKSFGELEHIYNVILGAASMKFPDISKEELAEKFGRCLAHAKEWDGMRFKSCFDENDKFEDITLEPLL